MYRSSPFRSSVKKCHFTRTVSSPLAKTWMSTKITIHSWSSSHHHVFFLPRSCRLGCYRLGLEQQKSRRIDREMENRWVFVLHFIGTGRGCFFNQEKVDASAVRQDFFWTSIHNTGWAGFFLRTWLRRGFVVLWIVLLVLQKWNKTTGHLFVERYLFSGSVDVPNLWGLNIIRRGADDQHPFSIF